MRSWQRQNCGSRASRSRRGAATITAILAVLLILSLSGIVLTSTIRFEKERSASVDQYQALLAANSGIAHAVAELVSPAGKEMAVENEGGRSIKAAALGGHYRVRVQADGDDVFTVTSTGAVAGEQVAVEVVVAMQDVQVFDHAVFSGNDSGDPLYTLELGGGGGDADVIHGDLYSGGDVSVAGDASITGIIRALGGISGASGETNVSQPIPDLVGMDYERSADFNVNDLFSSATYKSSSLGGRAWQVAESNPAHIFRRNPDDRNAETRSTTKDDYFIEDPYESIDGSRAFDGSSCTNISLSGVNGEPGVSGTGKVFYIDGNLWLQNKNTYTFELESDSDGGSQVTFVVKGNIYFSDNLYYGDQDHDGMAFIAMRDPDVPDSGNIYFGDPVFGTLKRMQSFMYAENNFYDNNLESDNEIFLDGNMSAGNQVLIQRDKVETKTVYSGSWWRTVQTIVKVVTHVKMTINFDERIGNGTLQMPGLPRSDGGDGGAYVVLSWRRVSVEDLE